ncbi:serine/threonine receptor-like kinase NFP [Iris pallida]|uniref:Serine/threonine receptor-like kinase NFP n=1 Tax=Iris pallida TaxID=29817 RepID=A0AAX6DZN6_IRIPA|nr:serine/threonine receptor-like kinase NFP [Iris pallida]KAJ6802089.1 serine/threonine receptor-like kinase NFP [Iris pallida]KAJ6849229.1 serine/threonine receptor-like kinase NFP [Iris pallida]
MELSLIFFHVVLFILFLKTYAAIAQSTNTNTTDFSCSLSSCNTYLAYRTQAPYFLDLGNISDLFGVSRQSIAKKNNLPSEDVALHPNQLLFIPIACGCMGNRSFANITYDIKSDDSYYLVSITAFENLTNYMAVMDLNPMFDPTTLKVGQEVTIPIFCKCPTKAQSAGQGINFLITYPWQQGDEISALAKMMNTSTEAFVSANNYRNLTSAVNHPVLIPVRALPQLPPHLYSNNTTPLTEQSSKTSRALLITSILLGSLLTLLLLSFLVYTYLRRYTECCFYRMKSNMDTINLLQSKRSLSNKNLSPKIVANKLLPGVTEYIDKPTLFQAEAIMEATKNLKDSFRLGISVYRVTLDGELYAVKLGKDNIFEELSILQKVNHANLVKLAGVSTETAGGFFMVYEFVQNGSLDQWLYPPTMSSSTGHFLSWKQRLMIALDVANGLQYLHEHTRPSIVHGCIQTSNILLNASFKAKISNFSKAKAASEFTTPTTDVYAFGIVLLELLSGRREMSRREGSETSTLFEEIRMVFEVKENTEDRLKMWMDLSLGGIYPIEGALSLATMARACTSETVSERPSMTEIVFSLSVLAHSCSGEYESRRKSDSGEHIQMINKAIVAR